jgi:hypothetical protein
MTDSLAAARLRATAIDKNLRADDQRLSRTVLVVHEEGTVLLFRYAFVAKDDNWYYIFTEHHGTHVYHQSDCEVVMLGYYVSIGSLERAEEETIKWKEQNENTRTV